VKKMAEERELIAPCGLYCGACSVHRARTDISLAEKLAKRLGMAAKDVACSGCRSQKGLVSVIGPPACETYECCVEKKGLEFCYQCHDFPCLKLAPCADRATEIPHNTKIYRLLLQQKMGPERLIAESENISRLYYQGKKTRAGDDIRL
jgi:hypothetical protein